MPELNPKPDFSEAAANIDALVDNEYPGRFIAMGVNTLGDLAIQAYAIMGRSPGSRNRIFERDQFGVFTSAPDKTPEEMAQTPMAELIYYRALKEVGGVHVVSNGAQTEPVLWDLLKDKPLHEAVMDAPIVNNVDLAKYEPDEDNFTPRITGVIDFRDTSLTPFGLSVTTRGREGMAHHHVSQLGNFHDLTPGIGYAVQTYEGNAPKGTPLPSFNGQPYTVLLEQNALHTADYLWSALNEENRVSIVVKSISLEDGTEQECYIINGKEQ